MELVASSIQRIKALSVNNNFLRAATAATQWLSISLDEVVDVLLADFVRRCTRSSGAARLRNALAEHGHRADKRETPTDPPDSLRNHIDPIDSLTKESHRDPPTERRKSCSAQSEEMLFFVKSG
jgi:hypothetical protein